MKLGTILKKFFFGLFVKTGFNFIIMPAYVFI